jgi:hypothetical protein
MLPTRCVFGLRDECEAIVFLESFIRRVEVVAGDDAGTLQGFIDAGASVYAVNTLLRFCNICPHRTKSGGVEADGSGDYGS